MAVTERMYLGIDLGTSSVKAVLIDDAGAVRASASSPLEVSHPKPRWSEQDPLAWWAATEAAVTEVLKGGDAPPGAGSRRCGAMPGAPRE
ncbi:MAG: FGGY family carbohydrate kinase, partial [Dyella sp.]